MTYVEPFTESTKLARAEVDRLQKRVAELRRVGQQLSNIAFNLAHGRYLDERGREVCDQARREWDALFANEQSDG